MNGSSYAGLSLKICFVAGFLVASSIGARGQEIRGAASSSAPSPYSSAAPSEVRALSELIRDLQDQVQTLNSQLGDLRKEQERASAEARDLRRELDSIKTQGSPSPRGPVDPYGPPAVRDFSGRTASAPSSGPGQAQTPADRIAKLEETQEVIEDKINDQYQTKVESGSKYRLRLSGLALLNLVENHGTLDTADFPSFAETQQSQAPFASPNSFAGTLRQSQIRLQAFGPDIGGARTSADVNFDFAGGFPNTPNGLAMGIFRLRTGTMRLDWTNTSIVAGQDRLFFVPQAPTSLATLAVPPLAYAGDLWAWTPQVRIEHRFVLSDASRVSFQAGILDNLTGDLPSESFSRYPNWGEQSGQPAYATHVSWSHSFLGQNLRVGVGGYYSRQDWGFNRSVDGWAATTDLDLPLGKRWEFTGAFYRGRAVAGLGGGIGQSVFPDGPFSSLTTVFHGLDSLGGWAQLKFKVRSNFEINGAFGSDNPYAGELRRAFSTFYMGAALTRNISPFVNFIYQIRSDILFSVEYQYFDTTMLDSGSVRARHLSMSMGYTF